MFSEFGMHCDAVAYNLCKKNSPMYSPVPLILFQSFSRLEDSTLPSGCTEHDIGKYKDSIWLS